MIPQKRPLGPSFGQEPGVAHLKPQKGAEMTYSQHLDVHSTGCRQADLRPVGGPRGRAGGGQSQTKGNAQKVGPPDDRSVASHHGPSFVESLVVKSASQRWASLRGSLAPAATEDERGDHAGAQQDEGRGLGSVVEIQTVARLADEEIPAANVVLETAVV